MTNQTASSAAVPTDPSTGPLIGVNVALAVLIASAVAVSVPVVACVYVRSRRWRKHIIEGYSVCTAFSVHAVCNFSVIVCVHVL